MYFTAAAEKLLRPIVPYSTLCTAFDLSVSHALVYADIVVVDGHSEGNYWATLSLTEAKVIWFLYTDGKHIKIEEL